MLGSSYILLLLILIKIILNLTVVLRSTNGDNSETNIAKNGVENKNARVAVVDLIPATKPTRSASAV